MTLSPLPPLGRGECLAGGGVSEVELVDRGGWAVLEGPVDKATSERVCISSTTYIKCTI